MNNIEICSICKRKLGNKRFSWINGFVGIQDITPVCEECNKSVDEQICDLIDEFKSMEDK